MHSPLENRGRIKDFAKKSVGEGQKKLIVEEGLCYGGRVNFSREVRQALGKIKNCIINNYPNIH